MKKLIILSAIMLGGLGIKNADAQFGIRIHLNLGSRPVYAPAPQPVEVDDQPAYNDDDYFYLPEVEAYYSVGGNCYYYQDGDRWISAAYLPGRYRDYDWRSARRYEIHANRPFMHHDVYRGRFGGYANRNDFYARAYPNRGGFNNNRDQYDNRGWNNQNRGGYDRHDDRNQGGYDRRNDRNQGGYQQQNPGRGQQGGYNQGGQQQPSQGRGGRGNDQPSRGQGGQNQGGGNNSQPANHNGGEGRGNYGGGQHFTANKMGVVNDRGNVSRPDRF